MHKSNRSSGLDGSRTNMIVRNDTLIGKIVHKLALIFSFPNMDYQCHGPRGELLEKEQIIGNTGIKDGQCLVCVEKWNDEPVRVDDEEIVLRRGVGLKMQNPVRNLSVKVRCLAGCE